MNLTAELTYRREANQQAIPADKQQVMAESTELLQQDALASQALAVGDALPDFQLPDATGKLKSLSDFNHEYLVVSFYRGGWCPYCNLELQALQSALPQLEVKGAGLIAISPETPNYALNTQDRNLLTFPVLSDIDNKYAKSLGLVFQMPLELREVYHSFDINVDKHNGNLDYELPMPATYVVNKNREVVYAFVPEDYTERLDPEEILKQLS